MPSPITSGFSKSVSNATFWHTLEVEQALALQSSDRDAALTNQQAIEWLQRFGTNELLQSGSRKPVSILIDQFTKAMLVMLTAVVVSAILELLPSRLPKDAIAISAIALHRTEEHSFSFLKGRRNSIELEDSLTNPVVDCGSALQDSVDAFFPYATEAPRVVNSTGLNVLMFV